MAPKDISRYRLRESIVVLGGPLSNVILLWIGLTGYAGERSGSGPMGELRPWTMLCLSNAALLLYSLWPHSIETKYGRIPNDLLLLWQTWRRPKSDIEQFPAMLYYYESEECRKQRNYLRAKEWLEEGLKKYASHYYLELGKGLNLLALKRYPEARRHYVTLLGRWSRLPELRFMLFNNIAWATLLAKDKELLWQVDACSRLALEGMPWSVYAKNTRGTVLVELGQFDQALPLLQEALKHDPEDDGRAIAAWFMGLAFARQGNQKESQSYFALTRKLDPNCFLLSQPETQSSSVVRALASGSEKSDQ